MNIILQLWGGLFYLANKVCFSLAVTQTPQKTRQLKLVGWVVYILGVPPWIIIFFSENNWIAASIELGAIPSMFFGLYNVFNDIQQPDKRLSKITGFIVYIAIFLGVGQSLIQFGGLTSFNQFLEIVATIGFLFGSYLLAKNNNYGLLFFLLMNFSVAILMFIQSRPILAIQQAISFSFVLYGFVSFLKKPAS